MNLLIPAKDQLGQNQEKGEEEKPKIILPNKDLFFVTDENLFKEINNYIKTEFPCLTNVLVFASGVMKQSNTYIVTAIDMFLKKNKPESRIARQTDLGTNVKMFKRFYIDSG